MSLVGNGSREWGGRALLKGRGKFPWVGLKDAAVLGKRRAMREDVGRRVGEGEREREGGREGGISRVRGMEPRQDFSL